MGYLSFDRFASNKGDFPGPYFTIISQWVMQIPLHEADAQCASLVRGLTFQHVALLLTPRALIKSKYQNICQLGKKVSNKSDLA